MIIPSYQELVDTKIIQNYPEYAKALIFESWKNPQVVV